MRSAHNGTDYGSIPCGLNYIYIMSCSLTGKTPFFGDGWYQFDSGQLG